MGLAAPSHVGSSQTGDWTCVPCIGRQILYHWATGEPLSYINGIIQWIPSSGMFKSSCFFTFIIHLNPRCALCSRFVSNFFLFSQLLNLSRVLSPQASFIIQLIKNPPATRETLVWFLGWEDPLEKGKAAQCSILGWRIPRTIHGLTNSWTWLRNFHFHFYHHTCILTKVFSSYYPFYFLHITLYTASRIFLISFLI